MSDLNRAPSAPDPSRPVASAPDTSAILRRLFAEHGRRHVWSYLAAATLMAISAAATGLAVSQLRPVVNGMMTFGGEAASSFKTLRNLSLMVAVLYVIRGLSTYGQLVIMSRTGNKIVAGVQSRVYERVLAQPVSFFQDRHSSEFISRLAIAANGVRDSVQVLIQAFLAIVPVLLILLLLYIVRRRRRRGATEDEERESLWSWSGLAKDVMALLNTLRPAPPPGGLRAALAQLRGPDPANRIRRSYIRFLLFGEQRNQPRAANQTAREYAPIAGTMVPEANQHIAVLTTAYEQARYNPESTTAADADMAERAWASIEQFGADEKPGTRQ